MNDEEVRLLIREAIQRHMGAAEPGPGSGTISDFAGPEQPGQLRRDRLVPTSISFGQYRLERAAGDTTCIIEPAVQCNHCGFCKCHGH